jgi:hypothetical protein
MRDLVASIEGEYRRYKKLGEGALAQLHDAELDRAEGAADNAPSAIVRHLAGNFASRFTGFLVSDGEKPDRDRESEFDAPHESREALLARWEAGWRALFDALGPLADADLARTVTIRGVPLRVHEALHRSLSHAAYHVGQLVYVAKQRRGAEWKSLSIPRGGSAAYNAAPTAEKPPAR